MKTILQVPNAVVVGARVAFTRDCPEFVNNPVSEGEEGTVIEASQARVRVVLDFRNGEKAFWTYHDAEDLGLETRDARAAALEAVRVTLLP